MTVQATFGIILYVLTHIGIHGKYIEGHLSTTEDWDFLTRFCFLSERGRLQFEFEYPKEYEPQNILLYYDEADQWPAVYNSDKSCTEREAVLSREHNQIMPLIPYGVYVQVCDNSLDGDGAKIINCSGTQSFRSARERWWFLAVSKCDSPLGISLGYRMWLTNGDDLFHKHFSADEFYILQVDIAFLMVEFVMLVSAIVVALQLKEKQLFHSTYKMFIVSLSFEVFHLLFMCIGYGRYANNGLEGPLYGFKTFARILESVSLLTFLLMLILMAKGFTITRGRISTSGSIKIAIFMTLYTICYAVLFIYEANFFDPGEVLYIYESPAGYGLIALRLLAWVWFLYAIFFTLKHYPEKSKFYFPFLAFYTICFFWLTPIMIIVAQFAFGKWYRAKIVNAIEHLIVLAIHLFFLILTRPSAANKNFPYHVRTSQIGIMENTQNGMPMSNDNFAHNHPYTPSSNMTSVPNGGPNFTELFTVANTYSKETTNSENNRTTSALTNNEPNGNLDKFPHQEPTNNPFVTQFSK